MKESRAFVTSTAQVSTSGSNLMPQAHRAFRSLHRCTLHNQPINVGSIEQGCVRSFEHVIDLASVLIYRFVLTAAEDHAVSWRLANAVSPVKLAFAMLLAIDRGARAKGRLQRAMKESRAFVTSTAQLSMLAVISASAVTSINFFIWFPLFLEC